MQDFKENENLKRVNFSELKPAAISFRRSKDGSFTDVAFNIKDMINAL